MLPQKELKLVHFQLTRNCNLRCWFCGQWGRKGFFSNASGEAMNFDDWKNVISDLINYREKSGISPKIMLWGGEPLRYAHFDAISCYLNENNFELGMITNGVLIDKHIDTIKKCIKKIYVSIDGPEHVHNSIRGEGVFKKVLDNLKLLKDTNIEINIMTVLSKELINELDTFPNVLSDLNIKELLLQEMIYLSKEETQNYTAWFEKSFGRKPTEIHSWQMDIDNSFQKEKALAVEKTLKNQYPFKVRYMPHGIFKVEEYCHSAFKHAHDAWNGNVLYCTDFYDFSAGNVKEENIIDIFNNSISEKFRNEISSGNCVTCNHCSWRGNSEFNL